MLVAIAYKYGQINNHNYLITASDEPKSDIEKRMIFIDSRNVHHNRGGKYGVAIWFVSEAGKLYRRNIIHYFPSRFQEEAPCEDDSLIDIDILKEDIVSEISLCDSQEIVERAAKNTVTEAYWSGKKTGLRMAFQFAKNQDED